MAVTLVLTNEQARWLSKHLDGLMDDWHWNSHSRPDADTREHVDTIKRKIDNDLSADNRDADWGR